MADFKPLTRKSFSFEVIMYPMMTIMRIRTPYTGMDAKPKDVITQLIERTLNMVKLV